MAITKKMYSDDDNDSKPKFPDWMSKLPEALHNYPLCRLHLPGSHDAAAYDLDQSLGIAIDRPDLQISWLVQYFRPIAFPIIHKYSVTQTHSIYDQLRFGVRYLDLRIGLRPENNEFYILHNMYGPPLADIIGQITTFAQEFPQEVIILDLQHLWGFQTQDDYQRLADVLVSGLEPHLIPIEDTVNDDGDDSGIGRLSLQDFWNKNKQLLLCWRDGPSQEIRPRHRCFWPASTLVSPWADTTTPDVLEKFLDDAIEHRPMDRLFVTQGVLTPHSPFVLSHPFGDLRWLAKLAREILIPLLFTPPSNRIRKTNIVMIDFITESIDQFPCLIPRIIESNFNILINNDDLKKTDQKS